MDKNLLTPCGSYCGFCSFFKKETTPHCTGCREHKGRVFWAPTSSTNRLHIGDMCRLYACATEHEVESCGLCKDFPCELLVGHFDGAPDNIKGQKETIYRVGLLAYLRKFGTEECLEMIKKLQPLEEAT